MRRFLLFSVICGAVLTGTASLAGAASGPCVTGRFQARLTASNFVISQAKSVKLVYRFPKPSTYFSYRLTVTKGSTQLLVKNVKQKGSFSGWKKMTVFELFKGKLLKVGTYRLELSCDSARTQLDFTIVPFSGRLTKKSFTVSEATSVKLIYAFSKPSKSFSYMLSVKKGSKWQVVRSARTIKKQRKAYFVGQRQVTVKSLFGNKQAKVGSYRLKIACAYSNRLLTFQIVKGPKGASLTGTGSSASGSGSGGGDATTAMAGFYIAGNVSGLELGQAKPIALTLTNPNGFRIYVTRLTVEVSADSTPPGCSSKDNLVLTQSNASSDNPIVVPANGSATLTSAPRAPQIMLLDLPDVNQDACKNVSFTLTYSGSAHS